MVYKYYSSRYYTVIALTIPIGKFLKAKTLYLMDGILYVAACQAAIAATTAAQ